MAGADDEKRACRESERRARQEPRSIRCPECGVDVVGNERRRKTAQHQEAHDAEVEEPPKTPLDVEAHCDQRKRGRLQQQQRKVGRAEDEANDDDEDEESNEERDRAAHHVEAPLKIPVGRHSSTTTRMMKATVSLYSVGTSDRLAGSSNGRMPWSGRSSVVQLNTASVSANPMRKPPAMAP
jgi:hypothetical protein